MGWLPGGYRVAAGWRPGSLDIPWSPVLALLVMIYQQSLIAWTVTVCLSSVCLYVCLVVSHAGHRWGQYVIL